MSSDKSSVRSMFGRIAPSYDLLNRLMTFWQDIRWRKILIRTLPLPDHPQVLDIGCGTGDLAREVRKQHPDALVVAADFTPEMVRLGAENTADPHIHWVIADAQRLPFSNSAFHAVICGYLLRNVPDIFQALEEQFRVIQSESWAASLDTTPPNGDWLAPLLKFYLDKIVPLLGRLIGGDASAYRYLSDSTQSFLDADQLEDRYRQAGFQHVFYRKLMFKTMALHWGHKPGFNRE